MPIPRVSNRAIIENRRQIVARLRLRGLSIREVAKKMDRDWET